MEVWMRERSGHWWEEVATNFSAQDCPYGNAKVITRWSCGGHNVVALS